MYERINWYKKEYVFENYSRIVDDFKDYDKISKKKMLESIYKVYSDYHNIIDISTTKELKYLEMVLNNKNMNQLNSEQYEWERNTLTDKFLLQSDYDRVFIPDEIIDNVKEAMERMIADGVTDLIVQPTHVINGIENDQMKEDVMAYASSLHSVSFGTPLLTTTEDNEETIRAVMKEWNLSQDEVLVFMGHGTTHYANTVYAALDYTFKDLGYKNVYMGTVEAYPSLESLLRQIHAYQPKKVHLAPFMIVAGDHASNDMSSEDPDSWKSQFEAEGFTVECHMKGLGEYRGIRDIFIRHAKEAAGIL